MESPDHNYYVVGRAGWGESALLLQEDALGLAVVGQALETSLSNHSASVCQEGDGPVVAILRRVLVFEQHPRL